MLLAHFIYNICRKKIIFLHVEKHHKKIKYFYLANNKWARKNLFSFRKGAATTTLKQRPINHGGYLVDNRKILLPFNESFCSSSFVVVFTRRKVLYTFWVFADWMLFTGIFWDIKMTREQCRNSDVKNDWVCESFLKYIVKTENLFFLEPIYSSNKKFWKFYVFLAIFPAN